jgi:hypothetical protein
MVVLAAREAVQDKRHQQEQEAQAQQVKVKTAALLLVLAQDTLAAVVAVQVRLEQMVQQVQQFVLAELVLVIT